MTDQDDYRQDGNQDEEDGRALREECLMDAAVIDRIRMLHDEGMPSSRIASTMGMAERDVVRQLPAGGMYVGMVTKPVGATTSVGPMVDLPVASLAPSNDVKRIDDPAQREPTARQKQIWHLVVDQGMSRVEAAEHLRVNPASIRNGLIDYMKNAGIVGEIPGKRGNTGPRKKAAPANLDHAASGSSASPTTIPDVVIQSTVVAGETVTTTGEPTTHVDGTLRILATEPVVISGADRASDIPAPIPGPVFDPEPTPACAVCGCTDERACPGGCEWVEDDLCSACLVASDAAITIDPHPFTADHTGSQPGPVSDPRLAYISMLIAKADLHGLGTYGDRIERALGIDVDRDLWAEGYRQALRDILDRMATMNQDGMRFNLTNAIARLAIDPPQV